MRSDGADRSRHQLQPKGPAVLRFAALFLGATPLFFLAFWGLGLLANLSLSMLPGSQEPVDLRWVFGLACAAGAVGAAAFEWGLRTGVRRAAERAEAGDQIGAARQLAEATGHGLEWSATAVQSYLDERPAASPGGGELPEEVRRLAAAGHQLRAAARLRELSGVGVEEAMRRVEAYLTERARTAEPGAAPAAAPDRRGMQAFRDV
jgi:hypothetical protein